MDDYDYQGEIEKVRIRDDEGDLSFAIHVKEAERICIDYATVYMNQLVVALEKIIELTPPNKEVEKIAEEIFPGKLGIQVVVLEFWQHMMYTRLKSKKDNG